MIKDHIKVLANWGKEIDKDYIALKFNIDERVVREAISELGHDDWFCFYIPAKRKGIYKLARRATKEELNAFAMTQMKSMRTIYFNKYRPLQMHIKDQTMQDMMGKLELIFIEDDKNKKEKKMTFK